MHQPATFDGSGNRTAYLFTRAAVGAAKTIDPATAFIPLEDDHPFKITVFWYGRNNFWTGRTDFDNAKAEVKAALAASIAHLKPLNCSGQLIPDTALSFSSATAGARPSLN